MRIFEIRHSLFNVACQGGGIMGIKNALRCYRVIHQPHERRARYDKKLEPQEKPGVAGNAYP